MKVQFHNLKRPGFALTLLLILALLCACDQNKEPKLDPKNPVTITVWHYYNGALMNAFEAMIRSFNEGEGLKRGIIVEGHGLGSIGALQQAVTASANHEVGSQEMPNIFASYADTAFAVEQLTGLADLDQYFSPEEQAAFLPSFVEEGRIGSNNGLRILPIAKATEIMMLNATDWLPFALANNLTGADLATWEQISAVSAQYYAWTDAQTPDQPNDGRAFFGRDSLANMFIIGSRSFGVELFEVHDGQVNLHIDPQVMRKIWDNYYLPYISGHFTAYGRYRSDDAKVGELLAYVGSTSSANYFPTQVTYGGQSYPVEILVLPTPNFAGGNPVLVQQGAGMVVSKGDPLEEFASAVFLKWFTNADNNSLFAASSGYMPVKIEALTDAALTKILSDLAASAGPDQPITPVMTETLRLAFAAAQNSELYTSKAFDNGAAARAVLENHLQAKAKADREQVVALLEQGLSLDQAVARFAGDQQFEQWLADFSRELQEAAF